MKCGYCGSAIIIPESLRTSSRSSGASIGDVFSFGLKGLDLNKIVGNAMQLPEVIALAQKGEIDQAARIYSQITGMQHADAVQAVRSMAAGHAVSLTPGQAGVTWNQSESGSPRPSIHVSGPTLDFSNVRPNWGAIMGVVAALGILIVGLVAAAIYLYADRSAIKPLVPAAYAQKALVFGGGGIGQGALKDPRAIGVDADGNITVADYADGRVQTFDSAGEFLSGFSISEGPGKVYVTGMGVSRDGTIYLAHTGTIHIYDPAGNPIGEIGDDAHVYDNVVVGGDGKLYATSRDETIVRFNADYSIDLEVPDTFTRITGDRDIGTNLAADGLGNMYLVGSFHYLVLKYSPQGGFIDQFGGQAQGSGLEESGKFTSPRALAVDGYGRIFVADFFDIKVFDDRGSFLARIEINDGVPFGITVDSQNRVYVVTNQNHVIRYDVAPPPQS